MTYFPDMDTDAEAVDRKLDLETLRKFYEYLAGSPLASYPRTEEWDQASIDARKATEK